MATIRVMSSKLHRVTVTRANLHYIGSISIDRNLLDMAGIFPLQEVFIANLTNGKRWSTYAIPGPAGSGCIEPNGGGAHMCEVGDLLIIWAFDDVDKGLARRTGHKASVVTVDGQNRNAKLFRQTFVQVDGRLEFDDGMPPHGPAPAAQEPQDAEDCRAPI